MCIYVFSYAYQFVFFLADVEKFYEKCDPGKLTIFHLLELSKPFKFVFLDQLMSSSVSKVKYIYKVFFFFFALLGLGKGI